MEPEHTFAGGRGDDAGAADSKGKTAPPDIEQLKSGGVIKQTQRDMFTIRLQAPGGRVPISKLKKITEIAEKYAATDYVHVSIRQSIEVPYVNLRDFPAMQSELADAGQRVASCGPRVRVPTACSGCEYNPNGLVATQKLAAEAHEKFFGEQTPHKFKLNFSGCPIDCMRTSEADLGFQGAMFPVWDAGGCIGCTICERACREGAIVSDEEGGPVFDALKCLACGDCVRNCPSAAWTAGRTGLVVRVGGRHGRHPLLASVVARFIPKDMVAAVIEKTIEWYRANCPAGEKLRLGDVLRKTGMGSYMAHMADVFGAHAVANPPIPAPVEIHLKGDPEQ